MNKLPLEPITARTIVNALSQAFADKKAVSKERLLDGAMKLSVLALDEVEKLVELEQLEGQEKVKMLEAQEKRNISEIELRLDATPLRAEIKKQRAFLKAIEEIIHTARLSAKLNEFA